LYRYLAYYEGAATSIPVVQCHQRASRTSRFYGIHSNCLGYGILQLFQRAPEERATRLEFGSQPEKTEAVMARDIQSGDELVEKYVELAPRLPGETAEPRVERQRGAIIHGRTTLPRGRLSRRVANARSGHQAANRAGSRRNPS